MPSPSAYTNTLSPRTQVAGRPRHVWREWEFWAIGLVVGAIYFGRLTALPICGEESRWANAASEMIATGDWIVPRQQGHVFPERPPLSSWAMALVGLCRGQVDAVAIRFPSALATTLLALVIYAYGRLFFERRGALAAALAFGTMGQVLQIGRLGESEAVFSLLLGSALLVWHAGRVRGWPAGVSWCSGYALAGLAALVKGPQAPVYFVVVTGAYLAWRRQGRDWFCRAHALGFGCLLMVIGLWQVPFWWATDTQAVVDIWSGLARDRFSLGGLLKHIASYPLETFGCLLPWSPLLLALADPRCRRALGGYRELLTFTLVAIAITYPSVWLSAGARGRYFMPLYPCFALLAGVVVESSTAAAAHAAMRRGWRTYLGVIGVALVLVALAVGLASGFDLVQLGPLVQPMAFAGVFVLVGLLAGAVLLRAARGSQPGDPRPALLAIALFLGLIYTGLLINVRRTRLNDIGPDVAALKSKLPAAGRLVSLGPAAHRFAWYFGQPIEELPWPTTADELPAELEYFCFEQHAGDTAASRQNGRGRTWTSTPGTLPFRWQQIACIPCDPNRRENSVISVVVGRVVRPEPELAGSPATAGRAARAAR